MSGALRTISALYTEQRQPDGGAKKCDPGKSTTPHRIKLLPNGRLDLSETPAQHVKIARRNAVESPLLRLPLEIRTRIFEFALGGETIDVGMNSLCATCIKTNQTHRSMSEKWILCRSCRKCLFPDRIVQPTAASRQIYSEFASLGFRLNTFSFCKSRFHSGDAATQMLDWVALLIPAHIAAITSIAFPAREWFIVYLLDEVTFPESPARVKHTFPNLTHLTLCSSEQDHGDPLSFMRLCVRHRWLGQYAQFDALSNDELLPYIKENIIQQEGGINVNFEFGPEIGGEGLGSAQVESQADHRMTTLVLEPVSKIFR